MRASPPNVLYVHSHDTGRCTEPYGFPVAMPAFQALAESGVTFRQAFSAAPTCSPSRAALLTGMAPHSAGMLGLAHRGFALHDPSQHLASFLQSHGYRTVLAGHQHLTTGDPHVLGYETVFECDAGYAVDVAPNAATFLRDAPNAAAQPFFLDVGFHEAHRPFHSARADAGDYVDVLPGLPSTPDIRQDVARFHESLKSLDRGVGAVLDALEDSGHADDTVVILTTDHGPAFPGMKSTLNDAGLGVGLVMQVPGVSSPGTVSDALVSQIDLYPTLCELIGVDQPPWLQGNSLVPMLTEEAASVRQEVFGEVTFHAAYEPQRAIRTDRWTFIQRFDERDSPVLPNIDASPALEFLLAHGLEDTAPPRTTLFDNVLDPLQRVNRAGARDLAEIEADLASRLDAWMHETDDPLLDGPVPLPAGGRVNRASDRSPDDPLVDSDYR